MPLSRAYIAIGSNIGEREAHCTTAIALLAQHVGIQLIGQSTLRNYPALLQVGGSSQDDYLNGVIEVSTRLSPEALLATCLTVEAELGRTRSAQRWQPRTIDLDLISYDQVHSTRPGLTLPHPELHKRRFVLEPLAEIAPGWTHPVSGKTVAQLLEELCNSS